jgi:hypothetical protein
MLRDNGGMSCFDIRHIEEDSYNFSPIILDIDEELERIRLQIEEDEIDRRTEGGKRAKKSRKQRKTVKRGKNKIRKSIRK